MAREISSEALPWRQARGLETAGLGSLTVVRADPRTNPPALLHPPETENRSSLMASGRYLAVTNASMFSKDNLTSVGYMRNFGYVSNPRVSSRMQGFLLFNPKNAGDPLLKVGTAREAAAYHTAFQTYRMWGPQEGILWRQGSSYFHSVALAGVDAQGLGRSFESWRVVPHLLGIQAPAN